MKTYRVAAVLVAMLTTINADSGGSAGPQLPAHDTSSPPATRSAPLRVSVAGADNEYVSIAAVGRWVAIAWGATSADGTDVYAAISEDDGRTFSSPVRVGSGATVNGEQPPRVLLMPQPGQAAPEFRVVWASKTANGTRLMFARSADGGRRFGPSAVVPGSGALGNRGWHSVAADAGGRTIVMWLDHREGAATSAGTQHHHNEVPTTASAAEASVARAATSRLYVGSMDGSVPTQGLVHGVCYCCKTAVAIGPMGNVVTAWRHVFAGGFRDIAFSQSTDGGRTFSTPTRVNTDGWQIAGCPENGPALAVDATGGSHVVWPTLVRESGRETMALFHAVTRDGRAFSERTRIPTGDAAFHPQLAIARNDRLFVAWDEGSGGTRRVRLVTATMPKTGQGQMFSAALENMAARDAAGTHPAVAATTAGAVLAWTRKVAGRGEIRVATYP